MLNFESYKGGQVEAGQEVKAYINLRNGKVALRNKKGQVLGYCDSITLEGAHFLVGGSLERVRRAGQKEVFAYCIGRVGEAKELERAVSFNPFGELDTFYFVDTREGIANKQAFEYITIKDKLAFV